jgi:putative redox protein
MVKLTATIEYNGDLRCSCTHLQSGTEIGTDAPTDNHGKGEQFSPTDLLCVSLATCAITTMAIKSKDMGIDLSGTKIDVTKHMASEPRRVGRIDIILHLPRINGSEKEKIILERTGDNCPVMKSIHPDIDVNLQYHWA